MKIHYLQHASFEGINCLLPWIESKGHQLTGTRLFEGDPLPPVESFDWLVIMGGPMNIYEIERYPWLVQEKEFITAAIEQNKAVLGICLGAQLIADVLGAKVYKNEHREIGWHALCKSSSCKASFLSSCFPEKINIFQWHGDTFEMPENAIHLCYSEACVNQGFTYSDNVVGLQFHPEANAEFLEHLVKNCADEIDGSQYVQSAKVMREQSNYFPEANQLMECVLDTLEKQVT